MQKILNFIILILIVLAITYFKISMGTLFILGYSYSFGFLIIKFVKSQKEKDYYIQKKVVMFSIILTLSIPIAIVLSKAVANIKWVQ
jgi:hypothetical protein